MTLDQGTIPSHVYTTGQKAGLQMYVVWRALIWILGLTPAALALTSSRTFGLDFQGSVANFSANQGVWLAGRTR